MFRIPLLSHVRRVFSSKASSSKFSKEKEIEKVVDKEIEKEVERDEDEEIWLRQLAIKKGKRQFSHSLVKDEMKRLEMYYEEIRRPPQASSILVILDYLDRTLKDLKNSEHHELINHLLEFQKKFTMTMASYGIKHYISIYRMYNSSLHKCVFSVKGRRKGQIVRVLVEGYRMDHRILRKARVIISNGIEPDIET